MLNPPTGLYSNNSSRRNRYSPSPLPIPKRSKQSNLMNSYDKSDQHRLYTSICVKNINPKLSDIEIHGLCERKFSKYGEHSIKIYYKGRERVVFINFTNCEDARKAQHAQTGLIWENMQVVLEPVYYRKTIPANQPIQSDSSRERSPLSRRQRRPTPPNRSPPPTPSVRNRSHYQSSSRRQRSITPPPPARRPYSPYIPLPPHLINYANQSSNRQRLSPPPINHRHQNQKSSKQQQQQRSRTPNNYRSASRSPVRRNPSDNQQESTRTLLIENLERDITESKLNDIFGRYGTIENIDIKRSTSSSSKRPYALIKYENMDMAYEARRAMNGQLIGKYECKIGYGKIVPTKYLWVGNISMDIKRRDFEHAFARYGPIKSLDYSTGDPIAIVAYMDKDDAIKARSELIGTTKIIGGRIIRNDYDRSSSSSNLAGFRIDFLDRPTSRRFVIVRPQQKSSNKRQSRSSSSSSSASASPSSGSSSSGVPSQNPSRSPSVEPNPNEQNEEVKTETHSRSPTPPLLNQIKQRRSTDRSETPQLIISPIAGRTFYGPLGSYLSSKDTENVNNLNELMNLCEQLNSSATENNTALATVYPVQFVLKSHAYDARLHFLAGSPTLASLLLGQPGDLVAAKTELKITQRLRLDENKLDDLERKLRTSVQNAITLTTTNNSQPTNGLPPINNRKQLTIPNQTKFSLLIASPKIAPTNESTNSIKQILTNGNIKNEPVQVKQEKIDDETDDDNEDETLLSRLISYLSEKEAAGVITIPFHPTYSNEQSPRQETAVLHIFPPCQFSKKILQLICPSMSFSSTPTINDEHLLVIIVHYD